LKRKTGDSSLTLRMTFSLSLSSWTKWRISFFKK